MATLPGLLAVAVVGGVVGCEAGKPWFDFRQSRPAVAPPAADVAVVHFAGSALTGPQARSVDLIDAWAVQARVLATAASLPADFEPVGPRARLVIGPDTGAVVAPTARLVYSAQLAPLQPHTAVDQLFGTSAELFPLGDLSTAIVPGMTASFRVDLSADAPVSPALARRGVRITLHRRDLSPTYEIAIASDDLLHASTTRPTQPDRAREVVVLQREPAGPVDAFVLALPMAFADSPADTLLVAFRIDRSPSAAVEPAVLTMKREIDASAAKLKAERDATPPDAESIAVRRAIDALSTPGTSPRGILTFLSDLTGAKLARTVALVGDLRLIEIIVGDVQSRAARLPSPDRRSVAWLLDRAAIDAIVSVKQDDADRILPPIQGALSIHVGEAGRQLDMLQSLAGEASSSEDLFNRIVAEHLILLEDSSPSLRVRAYEWLRSTGHAPAGYDPLATPQERRAALDRAREAAPTTAPAEAQR